MKRLPLFILQDHNFKKKVQWRLFFITVTFFKIMHFVLELLLY